jgi:hypothetical protein
MIQARAIMRGVFPSLHAQNAPRQSGLGVGDRVVLERIDAAVVEALPSPAARL